MTVTIAVAATEDWTGVSGHAGQARHWLLFDCAPGAATLPQPQRLKLSKEQLPHHFEDDGPHPLHGVAVMLAGSAGDGFVRHMAKWGAVVLLTGERDPNEAVGKVLRGETLPDPRFDVTTTLCRLRDLFARH